MHYIKKLIMCPHENFTKAGSHVILAMNLKENYEVNEVLSKTITDYHDEV